MIKDEIQAKIFESLKKAEKTELKVYRYLLSIIKYEEINKGRDLTDAETAELFKKEVKKRQDAVEMFKQAGRRDIVEDEEKQILIIKIYLPKELPRESVEKIIDEVIAGTSDKSNTGKIIGLVMARVKGQTDGSLVAAIVREKLSSSKS